MDPPSDIAQLSSILIIVLFRVDGKRCEFRDGTLLTMLISEDEGSPLLLVVVVGWRPAPLWPLLPMYRCLMSLLLLGRATNLVLVCVC